MSIVKKLLSLASVMLILVSLSACQDHSVTGQSFRFPLSAEPRQIDPQVATDPSSVAVIASLFEGLTRLNKDGEAIPAAANWTVSADGLTYTFTLVDSKWSDDSAVTANDFVFGMKRAVDPSTASSQVSALYGIQNAREIAAGTKAVSTLGVTAPDNRTVVITLIEPDTNFPEKVSGTPFMPCNRSFFESTGGHYGLEFKYILTNGPFFLSKWNHSESLLLKKSTGYHDCENILPASVRYIIDKGADPVTSLTSGDLDAAELTYAQIQAAKDAKIQQISVQDTIQYIWMNNRIPALSSTDVRVALRDSLEWDTIWAQLNSGNYTPAKGFAAPDAVVTGSDVYRNDGNARIPVSGGNQMAAKLASGLATVQKTEMPKLTLLCADDTYSLNIARYIVQSWQKNLSVYFSIEPIPESELITRVSVGNYQLAISSYTVSGLSALDAFGCFTSTAARGNLARFSNPAYDALYTSVETGTITRDKLDTLERKLIELCPSIPLSFHKRYVGLGETVSGVIIRPFGGGAFGSEIDFRQAVKQES